MIAMTRPLGTAVLIAASAVALMAPTAQAAKLKIGGSPVAVSSSRVASIGITNPNRSAAKGTLALKWLGASVGKKTFLLPARATRKVKVKLIPDAYALLSETGELTVSAAATARGKGTSKRSLTLKSLGGGNSTGGGGQLPGSGGGEPVAPPWVDGRYQGTYAENNSNLAFNVVGNRVFTGPFDGFYIEAPCTDNWPRDTDTNVVEPVEATIAPDGSFSGSGVYRPSASTAPISWTLTGRISGKSITDGAFSVSFVGDYGGQCNGTTRFTAGWYGDYTL